MKSVHVKYLGIPHFMAVCQECEWSYENHRDRREGQREIRKHVKNTGHSVMLEKAVCVLYSRDDS